MLTWENLLGQWYLVQNENIKMEIIIKDLTSKKAENIINILASLCKEFESAPITKDGWFRPCMTRTHHYEVFMHELDKFKTKLLKETTK